MDGTDDEEDSSDWESEDTKEYKAMVAEAGNSQPRSHFGRCAICGDYDHFVGDCIRF